MITQEELEFIEDWAILLEVQSRWPRNAGRLYAYMIVSDLEQHDQQELAESLGISQASVSTMLRRLMDEGLVERVGVPGSRRDNYRLHAEGWGGGIQSLTVLARRFIAHIDRALALPGPEGTRGRHHLAGLRATYVRMLEFFEAQADVTQG